MVDWNAPGWSYGGRPGDCVTKRPVLVSNACLPKCAPDPDRSSADRVSLTSHLCILYFEMSSRLAHRNAVPERVLSQILVAISIITAITSRAYSNLVSMYAVLIVVTLIAAVLCYITGKGGSLSLATATAAAFFIRLCLVGVSVVRGAVT